MKSVFLKNYTSDVPVSQTVYRIEQVLIKCGVNGITKEYGPTGEVHALRFFIKMADNKEITVRLPVERDRALDALWGNYVDGDKLTADGQRIAWNNRKLKCRDDFRDQAERTAWKIMQDWVEVQMSMIQMKQAETLEVFLPYIITRGGNTVYHQMRDSGFRALLPESASNGDYEK